MLKYPLALLVSNIYDIELEDVCHFPSVALKQSRNYKTVSWVNKVLKCFRNAYKK